MKGLTDEKSYKLKQRRALSAVRFNVRLALSLRAQQQQRQEVKKELALRPRQEDSDDLRQNVKLVKVRRKIWKCLSTQSRVVRFV